MFYNYLLKLRCATEVMCDMGYDDVGLLYHPLVMPGDCEAFGYGFKVFGVDCVFVDSPYTSFPICRGGWRILRVEV